MMTSPGSNDVLKIYEGLQPPGIDEAARIAAQAMVRATDYSRLVQENLSPNIRAAGFNERAAQKTIQLVDSFLDLMPLNFIDVSEEAQPPEIALDVEGAVNLRRATAFTLGLNTAGSYNSQITFSLIVGSREVDDSSRTQVLALLFSKDRDTSEVRSQPTVKVLAFNTKTWQRVQRERRGSMGIPFASEQYVEWFNPATGLYRIRAKDAIKAKIMTANVHPAETIFLRGRREKTIKQKLDDDLFGFSAKSYLVSERSLQATDLDEFGVNGYFSAIAAALGRGEEYDAIKTEYDSEILKTEIAFNAAQKYAIQGDPQLRLF